MLRCWAECKWISRDFLSNHSPPPLDFKFQTTWSCLMADSGISNLLIFFFSCLCLTYCALSVCSSIKFVSLFHSSVLFYNFRWYLRHKMKKESQRNYKMAYSCLVSQSIWKVQPCRILYRDQHDVQPPKSRFLHSDLYREGNIQVQN